MAKLNSKKRKKSSFYEEKSFIGLTPDRNHFYLDCFSIVGRLRLDLDPLVVADDRQRGSFLIFSVICDDGKPVDHSPFIVRCLFTDTKM